MELDICKYKLIPNNKWLPIYEYTFMYIYIYINCINRSISIYAYNIYIT